MFQLKAFGVLWEPDVARLAAMAARPIGCFFRQVGSDGCSPHQMLLGTGRCQVGSDGCARSDASI